MGKNVLDREWDTVTLLKFSFPTMVMMLLMGLYTLTDTIFVARFVNTDALSAVNIVCPVVNLTVGFGTMLAAGGNAVISREMGTGACKRAREDFTLLVWTGAALGVLIGLLGTLWLERIVRILGASERLFPYCREYLAVWFWFVPANVLQTLFANLFVTAGKPGLGFGLSALSGAVNIGLDYVFLELCGFGIGGAALGTGFSYLIPAAAGVIFFAKSRGALRFTGLKWRRRVLWESCLNGSSELVSQLASAVTTFLFNAAMLELRGEDGVAAITILIYAQFLLNTVYIGYSMGVAPVVGFLFGNGDVVRQKRVFRSSIRFIAVVSAAVFLTAKLGGPEIARLFAAGVPEVRWLAEEGFAIFSYSFLFCGWNVFVSAMFTALSNGRVSALLSFLRTFGFLSGGIILLPRFLGVTGVWLAVPLAEGVMFLISVLCLVHFKKQYGY